MNFINLIYLLIKNIFLSFFIIAKKSDEKKYNVIFPDRWNLSEDNAFFMFKYCTENNKENFKLVCIKNKNNINLLKKHNIDSNHILWFGEFKSLKFWTKINNAYYSHTKIHCFPTYFKFKKYNSNYYFYITHGIKLLKDHSNEDITNTFLSSEIIMKNIINIDEDFINLKKFIVIETPLFTNYFHGIGYKNNGRSIYIPTWFKCKSYKKFLKSHIVKQIEFLNSKNIDFDIYPHKYIRKYLEKYLKKNKIRIIDKTIFEIIKTYSICYTDNSSVAIDFLYLNKKAFVVNAFLPEFRLTNYRKTLMTDDINEIKDLTFFRDLKTDWF